MSPSLGHDRADVEVYIAVHLANVSGDSHMTHSESEVGARFTRTASVSNMFSQPSDNVCNRFVAFTMWILPLLNTVF